MVVGIGDGRLVMVGGVGCVWLVEVTGCHTTFFFFIFSLLCCKYVQNILGTFYRPEKNFSEGIVCSRVCDFYRPEKNFSEGIVFSRVCNFIVIFIFFSPVCYHDNSWKTQPIRTKFSHLTFDWNSSGKFEDGHHRSHVNPHDRGSSATHEN